MITLAAFVLVFLLGLWLGYHARFLKQLGKLERMQRRAHGVLDEHAQRGRPLWTCTLCGSVDVTDTFLAVLPDQFVHDGVGVQVSVCSFCLREVRLQR